MKTHLRGPCPGAANLGNQLIVIGWEAAVNATELLSSFGGDGFLQHGWNDGFRHISFGAMPSHWANFITPSRLDSILQNTELSGSVDFIGRGEARRSGDVTPQLIMDKIRAGASIRVNAFQRFHAGLRALCHQLSMLFVADVNANLYMTPPASEGLSPHFDRYNVFVIQLFGEKRWTLFNFKSGPRFPTWSRDIREGDDCRVADKITMARGDLLYMTRGTPHCARCGDNAMSAHVTISVKTLTYLDVIKNAAALCARKDARLREDVPPALLRSTEEDLNSLTLENEFARRLAFLRDRAVLSDMCARFQRSALSDVASRGGCREFVSMAREMGLGCRNHHAVLHAESRQTPSVEKG